LLNALRLSIVSLFDFLIDTCEKINSSFQSKPHEVRFTNRKRCYHSSLPRLNRLSVCCGCFLIIARMRDKPGKIITWRPNCVPHKKSIFCHCGLCLKMIIQKLLCVQRNSTNEIKSRILTAIIAMEPYRQSKGRLYNWFSLAANLN